MNAVFLLGGDLWHRAGGQWKAQRVCEGEGDARWDPWLCAQRMKPLLRSPTVLVLDGPEIDHQSLEAPPLPRRAFLSYCRLHAAMAMADNEAIGWGYEVPGVRGSSLPLTVVHCEMKPFLSQLIGHLQPLCLSAAFSLATVAGELSRGADSSQRAVWIMFPGYCAVGSFGAERMAWRCWEGPARGPAWLACAGAVLDAAGPVAGEPQAARACGRVVAMGVLGEFESNELWERQELRSTVCGIDEMAKVAARLGPGHSANLMGAFPRVRDLDLLARCITAALLLFGIGESIVAVRDHARGRQQVSALSGELDAASALAALRQQNAREIARLRDEFPDFAGSGLVRLSEGLERLAEAVPADITLISMRLDQEGNFEAVSLCAGGPSLAKSIEKALTDIGFRVARSETVSDPALGCLVRLKGRYSGGAL